MIRPSKRRNSPRPGDSLYCAFAGVRMSLLLAKELLNFLKTQTDKACFCEPLNFQGRRFLSHRYQFGRFEVLPVTRQLLAGGKPLVLGDRAFSLLLCLIEHRDDIVSKDDLMKWIGRAWWSKKTT